MLTVVLKRAPLLDAGNFPRVCLTLQVARRVCKEVELKGGEAVILDGIHPGKTDPRPGLVDRMLRIVRRSPRPVMA